ncbi:ribosomal-protein-alanine N-acetyltransferase RimI [Actinomycetes bacterium]|nr:ribosomal-protein-alanine N-acetyltransferase RimI [Actinomycetes bacterium]
MRVMRNSATNELTIEPMRRRHLRRVMQIEEQVYPRPWSHNIFVTEIAQMRSGARYYMTAYVGDTLVGYAGMLFSDQDAHVTNIAVDPEWQQRGVATELMLDVGFIARDRQCDALTLEVRHTNTAAQELYRRFGFVPAGVRKKYYENRDDALIMWRHGVQSEEFEQRLRFIQAGRS